MGWVRSVGGVLLVLIGLVWIGQGLNVLKGSGMSGHGAFVFAGIVAVLCGLWLLWGFAQARARARL